MIGDRCLIGVRPGSLQVDNRDHFQLAELPPIIEEQ